MSTIVAPDLSINPVVTVKQEDYASQLDFLPKGLIAPVYKPRRILQAAGGNTLSLSTSIQQSIFDISGDKVWNFFRSWLTLDVSVAGAGTTLNSFFTDCLPIDSITLQLASGSIIANIQNAQVYTKVLQHMATDLDEYFTRGPIYGDTAIGASKPISQCSGCQPFSMQAGSATAIANRTTAQIVGLVPSDATIIDTVGGTDASAVASASPANQASGSDVSLRGAPQRIVSGVANAGGGEGNLAIRYKINLSAFVGTILAMDKDLYFGKNLQLVINWKPISNWGFNVAAVATGASSTLGALTTSNYYLYMMEDINEDNHREIKSQVLNGGMSLVIPYTYCTQQITNAVASTYAVNAQLAPGAGTGLKRAIVVPVNAINQYKLSSNTFNVAGVKWSAVQSYLDSSPIQDQVLSLANSDVWNYLRPLIKRSPAGLSQRTFEENCFFVDNFSDCDDSTRFYANDCKESGLKVPLQRNYSVQFTQTSTAALVLYLFLTWSRKLVIKPTGVEWAAPLTVV